MKNRILLLLCLLFGLPALLTAQYDLWLLRLGDGDPETMTSPNVFALQKVQIDGEMATVVETYDAPSTDPASLITAVPSYSSDGQLSMSHDGRFLVFPGYGALVGQGGSIAGADAMAVPRVVARFNTLSNEFDTSTRLTNSFNRSNFRGATTYDGSGFWLTGNGSGTEGNSGLRYAEFGASESIQILSGNYTTINAVVFDGNIFYSRTTGTGPDDTNNSGILQPIEGLPTTEGIAGPAAGTRLPSNDWENGGGYFSFRFSPDGTALFVAALGGVQGNAGVLVFRYDEGDDLWKRKAILSGSDVRHLEVFADANDVVRVFYVSRETSGDYTSILRSAYYDLGTDEFTAPVELLSAGTGYVYYGVAGTDNPPTLDENMPLAIVSAAPGTNPEVGEYFYSVGTEVTVSAPDSAILEDGTRYKLVGWTADGSAPAEGTGNTITFKLNEPTTVEWQWEIASAPIAPIVGWNLRGTPTTAVVEKPASDVAQGVEQVFLTRGPGLELSNLHEGFAAVEYNTGNPDRAAAIASGDYFEFGFTVEEGYQAYVSSLDAAFRRSAFDSPYNLEWQYSLDGFATDGTPIVPTGKSWDEIGWVPDSSTWRSTTEEFFWEGASFLYLGRNSTGATTVYRNQAVDYNYITRDVTEQGAAGEPGNAMPTIDLRGISELQGVPAGTTVTFRLYAWGNEGTGTTNSFAFGRQDGPVVGGAVAPVNKLPVTVISTVTAGDPRPGIHFFAPGTQVTLEMPEAVATGDGVRHGLLGWEGRGSAPSEGTGKKVTFTVTEATTVEWLWEEQNRLTVGAEGDGTVDLAIRNILPKPLLGFDFGGLLLDSQVEQWNGVSANIVSDQVEPTVVTRGWGLTPRTLGSGGMSSESWDNASSLEDAINGGKYYGFVMTPKAGETISLAALYVPFRYTQTAPHTAALLYSTDGFGSYSIAEMRHIHDQASGTGLTRLLFMLLDDPVLTNANSAVEFRIYGIGGTSSSGTLALFNDHGYLSSDMILFGGTSASETVVGTAEKDLWVKVNARVRADARAAASTIFSGWSGGYFGNALQLKNINIQEPLAVTAHFETDSVGDGIPDWWRLLYFEDNPSEGTAGEDPDHDGFTNLEEYQRGTDPTVFNAALAIDTVPFSRWENAQRDHLLPGSWSIHDFGEGFRGALESSNQNRSAESPFHPYGESVQAINWISFDGPRMVVREEYWDEDWSDATYETVISVGDDDGNAFYFRYQDELNWYRVVVTGEDNLDANRPQVGVRIQKRVNGQYYDLYVNDESFRTDPSDYNFYKRVKVAITANGSTFDIEVAGWDQHRSTPGWMTSGEHGYTTFTMTDSDLNYGRAGIGTWAQGGGFQNVTPDWNPANIGTLFESFTVARNSEVVFSENWSEQPLADDLPRGWHNPFAGENELSGTWHNSAHGTIVQMATQGGATSATGEKLAADADGPILLAPEFESPNYLLELGFHPFDGGSLGFVFDFIDSNNYGRILFTNAAENRDKKMPIGLVISRKQNGQWSDLLIGDTNFVPTLGQPFVATLSRSGASYILNVQEVDRPDPLHRWVWEDSSAPRAGKRYGFTTWQTTNAHLLFADAYGVVAAGDDSDLSVIAIEKVGETIVLTIDNSSDAAYDVQRTTDLSSGEWITVDEDQTGSTWSGPIPAGSDRAFWKLVR